MPLWLQPPCRSSSLKIAARAAPSSDTSQSGLAFNHLYVFVQLLQLEPSALDPRPRIRLHSFSTSPPNQFASLCESNQLILHTVGRESDPICHPIDHRNRDAKKMRQFTSSVQQNTALHKLSSLCVAGTVFKGRGSIADGSVLIQVGSQLGTDSTLPNSL